MLIIYSFLGDPGDEVSNMPTDAVELDSENVPEQNPQSSAWDDWANIQKKGKRQFRR